YGDIVTLKRRRDDDADKDEEPSAGSDRGSKRRREGKEPESTSDPKEKTTHDLIEPSHQESKIGAAIDQPIAEASLHPEWFQQQKKPPTPDHQLDWNNLEGQQYPHNLLKPLPLIPNSRGRQVIPFDHFINNDLEYLRGGASSCKESALDVYSKRRIIAVTELKIVEWHNYKHLDWITVRRDDDKLYKFKE
nr:hypothetical protein [Tanacetum cinerariifolium]